MEKDDKEKHKELFARFVDRLCERMDNARIKVLIENGFDQWELVEGLTINDVIEIGYTEEEAFAVLHTRNQVVEESESPEAEPHRPIEHKPVEQPPIPKPKPTPTFQPLPITPHLLLKGTTVKPTKPIQKFLSTVTLISLQQKKITKISELQGLSSLLMLHLGRNNITKIEGLSSLHLLKTLKLEHNFIQKIEGLEKLEALAKLALDHNQIERVEGLENNYRLEEFSISDQRIERGLVFQRESMEAIGKSLETFRCNGNHINDISELVNLKILTTLQLKNNNLKEVSNIADVLAAMYRIKSVTLLGNPIVKAPKYRDYSVILSKSLQQLDGKKILSTEREYLVKLYSLKHAKQKKQEQGNKDKEKNTKKQNPQINVNKITEGSTGAQRLNSPKDFYNNLAYANSKRGPTSKK